MPIMPLKTKFSIILLAIAVAGAGYALAQALDAETQARIARFERGPATINVSRYPSVIQADYEVFTQKCSQCHKLSRPINSDYALPSEWSRYVHRMMSKPGSGIDGSNGKKIYEFLVYDSSVRKKAMVDAKLAKDSPGDKAAEEAKIKEVHDKYDR
jgi:hypothetical protein